MRRLLSLVIIKEIESDTKELQQYSMVWLIDIVWEGSTLTNILYMYVYVHVSPYAQY